MKTARPDATAVVAALLAILMWGAVPVGTRFLVVGEAQRIDPTLLVALRFGIAALVLLPALVRARPWDWPDRDRKLLLLAAGLGVVGYNLPVAIGQVSMSASATALVIATEPLWILVMWSLKRQRKPTSRQVVGACAGALGVAILAVPAISESDLGRGLGFVLLGALCWSAYCVTVAPLVQRHSAMSVTASTVGAGCLPLLLLAAPSFPQTVRLTGSDMTIIGALAIGSTVLATLVWNLAVARLPGPESGQFLFGIPIVGMATGHILLGEAFTWSTWLALIFITVGLWISRERSASASAGKCGRT